MPTATNETSIKLIWMY